MAQRVAAERVAAEEDDIQNENDCADADSEVLHTGRGIREPHSLPRIAREDEEEDQRDVHEVAMHVLENEWQTALSDVAIARLTDGAVYRVSPERLVIRAAIVVAGE